MARIQHTGSGHPRGLRPGSYRAWAPGEVRDVPGTTAADLLTRHPDRFARVSDRALRSPTGRPGVPAGVASRHWRTLVAEVGRGEHDAYLAQLSEAEVSPAVCAAIRDRTRALTATTGE